MPVTPATVFDLGPAEKLRLVEDLWDDLAANPADLPVPDSHLAELHRRNADFNARPDAAAAWDQVKHRIRGQHDA